jgi:hypothetical protein
MHVSTDTKSLVSVSTAKALEDVQARIRRLEAEGADNALVRGTLQSLRREADYYQQTLDEALLERWESVMAAHMRARRDAARHGAELAEMQAEYGPAVKRTQRRHDLEQQRYDAGEAAADYLLHGDAPSRTDPHDEQEQNR